MKRFLVPVFMMIALGLVAQEQALVKDFSGKVEVKQPGKVWEPAAKNLVIKKGTTISTGFNSFAVLDLGTSTIQVKPLTRMTLEELVKSEGTATTALNLRVGRVRAQVTPTEGLQHNFSLKSPVSTAAVRGTEFEFNSVSVKVFSGLVAFSNSIGQQRSVGGGEQSTIKGTAAPASPETAVLATTSTTISTTPAEAGTGPKQTKPSLGGTLKVTVQ